MVGDESGRGEERRGGGRLGGERYFASQNTGDLICLTSPHPNQRPLYNTVWVNGASDAGSDAAREFEEDERTAETLESRLNGCSV